MNIKWEEEKLSNLLRAFTDICNLNINISDNNQKYFYTSNPLYHGFCTEIQKNPKGLDRCKCSDNCLFQKCKKSGTVEIHICHAGLIDIVVPIIWNNKCLGYTILGQIRTEKSFDEIFENIRDLGIDKYEVKKKYEMLPIFNYEKIQSIITLATVLSKYVFMENILNVETNNISEAAISYINDNIGESLSINNIITIIGTSKSSLYKSFKATYNCTPGEYITAARINNSLNMLIHTDYSIEEISLLSGFQSASYYSKQFKNRIGISPLKYRRLNKSAKPERKE